MIGIHMESLNDAGKYKEQIAKCLNYIKENNGLKQMDKGKHIIDGDEIFVNVIEYETEEEDETYWEAHKEYLDLHFMIHGVEKIQIGDLCKMDYIGYKVQNDFVQITGSGYAEIILREGNFLLLEPYDAHRTGIFYESKQNIKKAVFKIKII